MEAFDFRQMLATFKHPKFVNNAYRSQVAFGYGEDVVLAGDDQGGLWAWNIIDVGVTDSRIYRSITDETLLYSQRH